MQEYIDLLNKNSCLQTPLTTQQISLGFDPVNAQDLRFSFLSFSEDDSMNISFEEIKSKITELHFYYHRGTSCRTPDGCNNISPLIKDLFGRVKTTKLPARINIHLFEKRPNDPKDKPDFKYIIHLH